MHDSAPLTTPFHSHATTTEVLAGADLSGRRAIVTGGASGIGLETTRALAAAGAEVNGPGQPAGQEGSQAHAVLDMAGPDQRLVALRHEVDDLRPAQQQVGKTA